MHGPTLWVRLDESSSDGFDQSEQFVDGGELHAADDVLHQRSSRKRDIARTDDLSADSQPVPVVGLVGVKDTPSAQAGAERFGKSGIGVRGSLVYDISSKRRLCLLANVPG